MADNFDNYGMKVRATVDMPSVGDIDKQIRKLEKSISKLQVSGKLDDSSLKALSHQLDTLKATVTTANFSPTALSELTNQVEKALGKVQLSGSLAKIGEDIGSAISQGAKQNIDSSISNEMKKISDSSTSAMIQNENKKQKEISESTAQYKELLGLLSKLQDIQNRVVNSPTRSKFSNVNLWKRNEIYSADDYTESWQAAKNIKTKYGEYTKSVSNGKSIEIQQATFNQVGKLIENYFVQYGKHSADILKQSLPKKMHPLIDEISDDVASFGERLKQYRAENIKQYGESIISSAYETVKAQIASMGKDANVRTITEPGDDIFDDVTKTISASDDIKSIIPDVSYNADTATESWKNFDAILQQVCNALGIEIPKAESVLESQSTSTTNTVIQNEEKKQQAIQETVNATKTAQSEEEKLSKKQAEKVNKIQHLSDTGTFAKQVSDATVEYNKLSIVTDDLKTDFAELQRLQTVLGTSQTDEELISNYEAFNTTLEKVKNNMHVLANEQKQARTYNLGALAEQKKIDSLAESVLKFRDNNTKMSRDLRRQFTGIYDSLINGTNLTEKEVGELLQEFTNLKLRVREAGQLGQSFGDKMKNAFQKFSEWGFATGIVTSLTSNLRESVTELKEIDNILTEIDKTSDLTAKRLKKLGDTAFDTASKYGETASDYLTGVQEMYRAGFDNAPEMAELSVLAQSAGDMDTTIANDYLLATNAAYKYKGSVEELNKVLDSQNYITNNAAISMKDIADATTETASVAAQYGVKIDELSALIATATANTRESGSEVGTALKAILINLQDTTSKPVTDTFNALGISMTKVVNGAEALKTPIELIHELADAYNSLPEGDIMRANILNEIGQKRHAKVCVVI